MVAILGLELSVKANPEVCIYLPIGLCGGDCTGLSQVFVSSPWWSMSTHPSFLSSPLHSSLLCSSLLCSSHLLLSSCPAWREAGMPPGPLTIKSVPSCQRIYGHESPFSDPLFTNLLLAISHPPDVRIWACARLRCDPSPLAGPRSGHTHTHTHALTYILKTQRLPVPTCCRIGWSQMCPAKKDSHLSPLSLERGKSQGQTALFTPKEQGPWQ